jgi:hypothetical protein
MAIGKGRITRCNAIAYLRFDILRLKRGTYDEPDGRVLAHERSLELPLLAL